MIHILLTILKIIGILLLVLLGLILMIVVLVLFVPLRYRFHVGINEGTALNILLERAPLITDDKKPDLLENLELTGSVIWLLRLVRVTVKFFRKTFFYKVQAAFFDVLSSEPKEKRKRRAKRKKIVKAEDGKAVPSEESTDREQITPNTMNMVSTQEKPPEAEVPEAVVKDAVEDEPASNQAEKEQKDHNVKKEKKPKKDIQKTIEELSEKAHNILDMINDTDNQEFVRMALKSLKKLLWHIRPRNYFLYLYYGADDPSLTGKVMMAYGIAKGVLGMEHLEVMPDFEHKVVRLSAELEGKIRLIHVAVIGCKIYFNKTFRKLIGGR